MGRSRRERRRQRLRAESLRWLVPLRKGIALLLGLALVVLLAYGGYRYTTRLGPDELPTSVSDSQRGDIETALRQFFAAVNQNNPQAAGEAMLSPKEVGIEEFARMVYEIAALESAEREYRLDGVHAERNGEVIAASAETSLGVVDFNLVRREGNWRIASAPVLRPQANFLPYQISWKVTNTYRSDAGLLGVVGQLRNIGTTDVLYFGGAGVLAQEDGRAVRTESSPLIFKPLIRPSEVTVFRIELAVDQSVEFHAERFTLIPNLRVARGADDEILAPKMEVTPRSVSVAEAGAPTEVTVSNGNSTAVNAVVTLLASDSLGVPLAVSSVAINRMNSGTEIKAKLPKVSDEVLSRAVRFEIQVWGAKAGG